MPNVCAKQAVYTRSRIRSSSDVDHDEGEGIEWSMLAVLAKNVTASRAQIMRRLHGARGCCFRCSMGEGIAIASDGIINADSRW